ncbi:hypothetical protein DPMN_027785 [Dreissena polymorpha]|uniref:Uncharacterized protein n=1 Tax=Dreissena polymorpha TaxID=45954 RepID=A0A9D4LVW8_DREPO|nr:hypothetical protein DPMN_027785 [Dreissena polymorpha]
MRHLGPEFESAVPEKAQEAIASQQDGGSNLATGDKSHSEMLIDKSYGKTTTAESENDFIELKTMDTNFEQAGGKTNFETVFFSDDKDLRDMEPHDTSLKLSPRIPENFETLYKSVTEEEASYLDDVEKNTDIDEGRLNNYLTSLKTM